MIKDELSSTHLDSIPQETKHSSLLLALQNFNVRNWLIVLLSENSGYGIIIEFTNGRCLILTEDPSKKDSDIREFLTLEEAMATASLLGKEYKAQEILLRVSPTNILLPKIKKEFLQ